MINTNESKKRFSKKVGRPKHLKYKFNKLNHPKVRSKEDELSFIEDTYPVLLLTEMNIEYNGGISLHRQYNDSIQHLQQLSGSESNYGARLFIYMTNLASSRKNKGFKVSLDPHLFIKKKDESSYNSWTHTLEAAVAEGYGALYIGDGSEDRDSEGQPVERKYFSVFHLTDKAFELLDNTNKKLAPATHFPTKTKNLILTTKKFSKVVKGGKVKKWEEDITPLKIKPYKESLNKINNFQRKFTYTDCHGVVFDPTNRRKFSIYEDQRVSDIWDNYGRYINIVHTMSRSNRALNRIEGEEVFELDYSSQHPRICYELEDIYKSPDFKPYHIDSKVSPLNGTEEAMKSVYKSGVMMLFNSGSPSRSLANTINEWFDTHSHKPVQDISERTRSLKGLTKPKREDYSKVIQGIKANNPEIIHYFDGKQAPRLQNIDSRIAERVMLILVDQNVPFICIHDSFQVPKSKWLELYKAMLQGWKDILGTNDCCVIDGKCEASQKLIDEYTTDVIEDLDEIFYYDEDGNVLPF